MRVLITGAAGFLGTYIARRFASHGHTVVGTDRRGGGADPAVARWFKGELTPEMVRGMVAEVRPDVCIHAAGPISPRDSVIAPLADFSAGPPLLASILDSLRSEAPSCRMVYLSSAAVYGDPARLPIVEDEPPRPISPYGYHKRMGELLLEEFADLFGSRTASVRIFSAYGPGLRRQVLFDICRKAYEQEAIVLQGSGLESRDFIHAEDVAAAVYLVATAGTLRGEIYNVANGQETRIAEVARRLLAVLAVERPFTFDGQAPKGVPARWQASIDRISRLGFVPSIDLLAGIEQYAGWWKNCGATKSESPRQDDREPCRSK